MVKEANVKVKNEISKPSLRSAKTYIGNLTEEGGEQCIIDSKTLVL